MVAESEGDLDAKSSNNNSIEMKQAEARVSGDGNESEAVSRVLDNNEAMTSDVDKIEEEPRVFEGKNEKKIPSFVQFDLQNDRLDDPQGDEFDDDDVKNDDQREHSRGGDTKVAEVYNSLLSEFDDFVANENHGAMEGTSRALRYGFEVGDMVWGKVKSHPWWPGHIFNEAFASSSVRRTRREGYVLVAFFGDSSYGWFDPAELIPFDPNFAVKSQQTNSRTFVKAVEEAMDEASRRSGLGLICRCRNKFNFRPANVQGYFEVDVPNSEVTEVYSESQIKKAQESFQPHEALAFVKHLACAPKEGRWGTIDFVKNRAKLVAFRKAVFEEFDETYAQAFGAQTKRSGDALANPSNQPAKFPIRAPLSGPLVIAEALGSGKSSKKATKVKDQSKKDRYLIKRRDEPIDSGFLQIGQEQAGSLASTTSEEGSSVVTCDYVLQKRASAPVSSKNQQSGIVSNDIGGSTQHSIGKTLISDHNTILDEKASLNMKDALPEETKDDMGSDIVFDPSSGQLDISLKGMPLDVTEAASPPFQQEGKAMADIKYEESTKVSRLNEGSLQTESFAARAVGDGGSDKTQVTYPDLHFSPLDTKCSTGARADVVVKKQKVLKRPLKNLSSEDSVMKRKKKKKKKDSSSETSPDRPKKKHLATGKDGPLIGNVMGKPPVASVAPREDSQVHQQKKDVGSSNASSCTVGTLAVAGIANVQLDIPHLLTDLHVLALDPFHGVGKGPSATMQFFLRFRASVYQKSLVLSAPPESEPTETSTTKSSSAGVSEQSAGENARESTPSRPVKAIFKSDDPTKGGRKRAPSDRQEEIAAKRLKKINQLKSLSMEKKTGQRSLETHRTEEKEPPTGAPPKPVKSDSVKKMEPQARAVQPTMLVMKFPPETSLPSANMLKARFARFGSIDQSAIRVFWASSTCRVVFLHKQDAQAAYKYAVRNNSLFNNVNVRYSLREVGAPASEAPESDKGRGEDTSVEAAPRVKDPATDRPSAAQQPIHQSTLQLKSILKKPAGEEATGANGGRGTARVKFMLRGEESTSRGDQLMVGNRNFDNNASFADGGAPTSSVAMDFSSKNFQKVIPQSTSPPILPIPIQSSKQPLNNLHHTEVAARNMHNFNHPIPISAPPGIDISQQMLSLLTRCNDVVTSVTGFLGYVPYHPL